MPGAGCSLLLLLEHKYAITKPVDARSESHQAGLRHSIISSYINKNHIGWSTRTYKSADLFMAYILTWIQTASAQVFKYLIILAHLEPILREGWDNTSQMPYKASFSHIHSSSMQPGSFFLCVCNMVQTAFPTQANVKQTLTNLPLNSSHHQIRERGKKVVFIGSIMFDACCCTDVFLLDCHG